MAFQINPNIALSSKPANILGAIQSGLQTRGMFDQFQQSQEEAPIRQQLLEQQAQAGETAQVAQAAEAARTEQNRVIKSIAGSYGGVKSLVDSGKFLEAADALEANKVVLKQSGVTNFEDSDLAINALRSGDSQAISNIKLQGEQAIQLATDRNLLGDKNASASEKEFNKLIAGMSPEDQKKARRVKVGLDARAVGSAAQTIADTGATEDVAGSQEIIEAGKSKGKATGTAEGESESANLIADTKAGIETAVTLAKADAESRGETLSELQAANASMPSLIAVVDELKQLAPMVTSTMAGNVFDFAVKESGFGSTEGSTAKAKFTSVINNQILPLLKQTFGAAFTVDEKNELKATMGNVDATAEEKIVQLNAFIEGKIRSIQDKERQLGQSVTPAADITTQDTGISAEQFRAMSPEQRAAALQQLQGGQ